MSDQNKRPASGGAASSKKRKYVDYEKRSYMRGGGMRGVLVTCDVHVEKSAIRESCQLFEQHTEEAAPAAEEGAERAATAGESLAAELQALQGAKADGSGGDSEAKQFSVAQTGVQGVVMIRFADKSLDPAALVGGIVERAQRDGNAGAPHVVRMYPVQATCHASVAEIVAAATPLLSALRGFEGSFAINWRRRCNSSVDKMEVIEALASAAAAVAPKARVELRNPQAVVNVDVIKTTCCLGVLPDWRRHVEYNLREAANPGAAAVAHAAANAAAAAAKQAAKAVKADAAGGTT